MWREYAEHGGESIPRRLERDSERLRLRYLALIYDIGATEVGGKRIIEHLALEDGFSFWWMTRLAEKSPFKSPRIYDCLRVLVLEEVLRERKPTKLVLESPDRELAESVEVLCRSLAIPFVVRKGSSRQGVPLGARIRKALPFWLRGFLTFSKFIYDRLPLLRLRPPKWSSGPRSVFFCSFFANVDTPALERGEFQSRFWGPLPAALREEGYRVNWLQQFVPGPGLPRAGEVAGRMRRWRASANDREDHGFLDSYLSTRIVSSAFLRWMALRAAASRLGELEPHIGPALGGAACLWPLLRPEWLSSVKGPVAAVNCLWLELFDAALGDLPRQEKGVYLWENQAWERAFLRAWRKHGHGNIVAVAHSTVPFWHLYYFDDLRLFTMPERLAPPMPDRFAVNGPAAWAALESMGYPLERLAQVEALRYLDGGRGRASGRAVSLRVLVVGDIIPASMEGLLKDLARVIERLPTDWTFTLKPHPLYDVVTRGWPGLDRLAKTAQPLGQLLRNYDAVLSAVSTSAAVDAYEAGLPVVIRLDGSELNLSPLRGQAGVCFVGNAEELVEALRAVSAGADVANTRESAFFLDRGLPRWRELLF